MTTIEVNGCEVKVSGALDMESAPKLKETVDSILSEKRYIRIDLDGVDFICSVGLLALAHVLRTCGKLHLSARAAVELANVPERVQKLLDRTDLAREFGYSRA